MSEVETVKQRRLGRFGILGSDVNQDPATAFWLMEGMLVVRAEHMFARDMIEYTAYHEDFDPLPMGQEPPWYGRHNARWTRI